MLITEHSLLGISSIVNRIYNDWKRNPAYILTEADLQCILYSRISESSFFGGFHGTREPYIRGHRVHSEVSWYNERNNRLRYRTDITILDTNNLSILQGPVGTGFKLPSKRFYFDGQAIIFELKFNRNRGILRKEFVTDIEKDKSNITAIIDKFEGFSNQQSVHAFHILFDSTKNNNQDHYEQILNPLSEKNNVTCIYKALGPLSSV